jgi:dienelactone hydrolase
MTQAFVLLAIVGSLASLRAQEAVPDRQLAARVELHGIQTVTLSDEQFLRGDTAAARPATIGGELRIAQGTGRLPVVVMLHGSSGVGANIETWVRQFNEMGISTLVLDSLTGRGLTNVSADQASLGRLNAIVDAYRALAVLAGHPRVEPSKIVLMGFSRGGQGALYASLTRFHRLWNASGRDFAAYVPIYPDCSTSYVGDQDVAKRPIRIFHATADDYDPVAPCKAYVERLRGSAADVQLVEYPNAPHTFDNPLASLTPAVAANAQTVRHCSIMEDSTGRLVNALTKQPFTYADPCVELNPHTGYEPVAARAAHQAVAELLRTVFKLR